MCLTYDRLNRLGKQIVKLTNASPFIEVPPTSEESRDDATLRGANPPRRKKQQVSFPLHMATMESYQDKVDSIYRAAPTQPHERSGDRREPAYETSLIVHPPRQAAWQ
jgi:hypothetical protein